MIYYTIGLPRSSKSTFAAKWKEQNPDGIVLNADTMRLQLYGQRYFQGGERFITTLKFFFLEYLHKQGHTILVDGTHTTASSIQQILDIDADAIGIYFDASAKVCKERAIESGQEDLLPVIDRMNKQLDVLFANASFRWVSPDTLLSENHNV